MEVIKSIIIGKHHLALLCFEEEEKDKSYEVQYSNDNNNRLNKDAIYQKKKDGLKVFNEWLEELQRKEEKVLFESWDRMYPNKKSYSNILAEALVKADKKLKKELRQ